MGKLIDMTGQTIGFLEVLGRDPEPHAKPYWLCKCKKCGNIISVYGNRLRNGSAVQCKFCSAKEAANERHKNLYADIIGKHFNHITVIKEDTSKPGGAGHAKYWVCKCDCGKELSLSTHKINTEEVFSCGCMKQSKGEEILSVLFSENNIVFEQQKSFETCRFPFSNALAKFDFYLPDYNLLVEFDGRQHFEAAGGSMFTEEIVEAIKERDCFKNQWCQENNITLVRFTYKELKQLNWDYVKERLKI